MKCRVCGHSRYEEYDELIGDYKDKDAKKFITILGHYAIQEDYCGTVKVELRACPICNTVIVDKCH